MPALPVSSPLHSSLVRWVLLTLAAILLGAALFWALYVLYQARTEHYRHQAERELMAVTQLQAGSVADWRRQKMDEARALSDDTQLAQNIAAWLRGSSEAKVAPIQERLRILQERAGYTMAYLVDGSGQLRLNGQGGLTGALPQPEQLAMQEALKQASVATVDPRHDPAFAFPFFSLLVPIFEGLNPVGAIWLVADVRASLYRLLATWPTPSETAESSLIARSGDDVIYLSPLRHGPHAGSKLSYSINSVSEPAVQAALGVRGVFYSQDYRGMPVIAVASAVPDSPWLVVGKVDVADVLADNQRREVLALSLPVALGLLFAGFVFAGWQRRAWARERGLKNELQRTMGWLESAQKSAQIGYFAYDSVKAEFTLSSMAYAIFGLPPGTSFTLKQWRGCIDAATRQEVLNLHLQALQAHIPLRTQYRIQRLNDQKHRWVEVWGEFEDAASASKSARLIGTIQDITERKRIEQDLIDYRMLLEEKVLLDPLTQIANRRALDEHLQAEWLRAMRNQTPLALLMVDIDYFKLYNDHYGHVAGDQCLRHVAQAIASVIGRNGELAARFGGEEFTLVLPYTNTEQAMQVGARVVQAVHAMDIEHLHSSVSPVVTVSVGVASVQPVFVSVELPAPAPVGSTSRQASPSGLQALFEQADLALYQAKQQGRNRVVS